MRHLVLAVVLLVGVGCSHPSQPAAPPTPTNPLLSPAPFTPAPGSATGIPLPSPAAMTPSPESPPTPASGAQHKLPTEKELGVPFYPGAKTLGGGRMETGAAAICNLDLETADPASKVVMFYSDKLTGYQKTAINDKGWSGTIFQPKPGQAGGRVTITQDPHKPTRININSVGGQ